jgi:threonine dehydratase
MTQRTNTEPHHSGIDPRYKPLPTTFVSSRRLAAQLGVDLTIATETFQHTGSFKFRGAFNTAAHTDAQHIIAASSGNFGQALACACQLFRKRCTIVMPLDSTAVKVAAVRSYGATVEFIDVRRTPRAVRVRELLDESPGSVQAFPSDGELMLAGNESLGAEIVADPRNFDVVVVPIGGGGVGVGCIRAVERSGSKMKVVGVEPHAANDVVRSFRSGERFVWDSEPVTIADGVRTLGISVANWEVLKRGLATMMEVADETIIEATRMAFLLANLKVEPTGALALATLLEHGKSFTGLRVCCVATGGNVSAEQYARILSPVLS